MSNYRFKIIGIDGTKGMFRSVKTGLKGVRSAVNSTQVRVAGLAGAAGLGMLLNSQRAAVDALAKTSDELGIQTEKLAALHHAAELTGSSREGVNKGLKKLAKSIADANNGLTTYTRNFEKLELDPQQLARMTPDEQFRAVGEALAGVESQTERVAIAYDIFGGRNTALLNTLVKVGEEWDGLEQEVQDYGIAISRLDAAKVEEANDQLQRVGQVVKGVGNRLAVKLSPLISVVSDKFIAAATNGQTMGRFVTRAMELGVKGVGMFADGLHGIKIAFTAIKVGADFFAAGILVAFRGVVNGAVSVGEAILKFVLTPLRKSLEIGAKFSDTAAEALADLNAFSTIESPAFLENVNGQLDVLFARATENKAALQELLMADLPSAVIEQRWAEISAEAERRAAEVAARVEARLAVSGGGGAAGEEPAETDAEREKRLQQEQRERERVAARLQRLEESYFSELQLLEAKHTRELELIQQAEEQKLITEQQANERRRRAGEAFEKSKQDLAKASTDAQVGIVGTGLQQMQSFMGAGSKKMFKVQKAAALAQAAVALPPAIVETFKNNGGFPWGLVPAGLMAAKGAAQIASIKKQTLGGGAGSTPSVGGGSSAGGISGAQSAAASAINGPLGNQFDRDQRQAAAPQNVLNLHIGGDVVGDSAEGVLNRIRDLVENKDVVLFSSNSRQAQELAPVTG